MRGEERKKAPKWLWPAITVFFIAISVLEISAFEVINASKVERVFWWINLIFWCVTGLVYLISSLRMKK